MQDFRPDLFFFVKNQGKKLHLKDKMTELENYGVSE
jgi:hypothetical protein